MEKNLKNYYIGVDMGTDSVGWAVTDTEYNLLRSRGRDLWGSYLFDEAATAAERRAHRTARRRYARTRRRINLLQELFLDEITKTDPLFFIRLNNSSLIKSDKDGALFSADALFGGTDFDDKKYFEKYPTIYHLRAALIDGEVNDVRLLYLAVHHIIKNRGHFLFESQNFDVNDDNVIKLKFSAVNEFLKERDISELCFERLDGALAALKNKSLGKKDKSKTICELLAVGKDKCQKAIVNAVCGCTVSLKDLYAADENYDDITSFSFDKPSFDESDLPKIESAVGFEEAELVRLLKAIYDWSVLCDIMGGSKYISQAKIRVYEKHKSDLARLKSYVRANCPEKYNDVFRRRDKTANYAAYIGMDKKKGFKKCGKDDFYKFLKSTVKINDEYILSEMESGDFMPKQVSSSNGVIPYQVNLYELRAILTNAEKYFPFLTQAQDGYTVSRKIQMLMTFRVPYYVGPLNTQSQFSWAVKNQGYEREKITPWNFDEAIDKDGSEKIFIRKMTNKCTYLVGEDVLPANSLLYSEFTFLNELNNLKINGEKNDNARGLIFDYAKTHKKVTLKAVHKLLVREGVLPADSKAEEVFSGIDGDFKTSLAPFVQFAFLGDRLYTNSEMIEEIILWITVCSDSNRLEKMIREKYGKILSVEEIKRIKGLKYTKWGRLSKKLLTEIKSPYCADENGEMLSIIQAMRATGENFMQLLSSKYGFAAAIAEYNGEIYGDGGVTYKTVQDLYCSPSVKRGIWRTVCLVREIVKIQGRAPEKIFVETTREQKDKSKKKERTKSRKQQIIDLYKNIKDEERDWIAELENTPDSKFNSDKVVLYYRQMGRCMYTGKPISLDDIFNQNRYDKDHIYPRSKIKDDSLDNLVFVCKEENANKNNIYPLSPEIRSKMKDFWALLKAKGLISDKKFDRLIRNTPLTVDECSDFINRQLVFTGQSTKAAAQILKRLLPETEVVYAKADNASEFRKQNKIIKVRELNDLHHAKDAYINIVVGNVYNTKFNHNAAVYFKNNNIDSYNLNNLYNGEIAGAWKAGDRERIKKIVSKNTCRVVRMTSSGSGALFDVNPKAKGADLIPLKTKGAISDASKYGGYNSATTAYFMLVRSVGKKNKTLLSLEAYPLYLDLQTGGSKTEKLNFCARQGLVQPEILIDYIKLNTLFRIDGSYVWIRGKSDNRVLFCNASQLILEEEYVPALKAISKYMNDKKKLNRPDLPAPEGITAENNLTLYDKLVEKLGSAVYSGLSIKDYAPMLKEKRGKFISLTIEEQCVVLWETLRFMQCNSVNTNLELLGEGKRLGIVRFSKFIQDNQVKMITQSPTGHYREITDFKIYL